MILGDFNHDNIPDAAVLGQEGVWIYLGQGGGIFAPGILVPITGTLAGDGIPTLSILLGNGDATFQFPVAHAVAPTTQFITSVDLNGDGKPDLVMTSATHQSSALILFGNGDGTFQHYTSVSLPNDRTLAIADVNGDGLLDLVSNGGFVVYGKGDGKFSTSSFFPDGFSALEPETNILLTDLRGRVIRTLWLSVCTERFQCC